MPAFSFCCRIAERDDDIRSSCNKLGGKTRQIGKMGAGGDQARVRTGRKAERAQKCDAALIGRAAPSPVEQQAHDARQCDQRHASIHRNPCDAMLNAKPASGDERESEQLKATLGAAPIERDLSYKKIALREANRPMARRRRAP